jgi:maltoporin
MFFYGTGAAENYKAIIQQPLGIIPAPGETIEVPAFRRFRVLNDLQIDINSKFSLLGLLIYQQLRNGQASGDKLDWISAGLRPAYHFSRYFSLVAEFGLDYTSQKDFEDGILFKMTLAPQISPLNKILSRPALRAYFTYAKWSEAYVGSIAANSFPDQDNGISIGIQMEVWW